MSKPENKKARYYARIHAQRVSSVLEDILYFVYRIVLEDYDDNLSNPTLNRDSGKTPTSQPLSSVPVNAVDVVALFVNGDKGISIKQYILQMKKIDPSITRDLFATTEYMWSGEKESEQFDSIINLMTISEERSSIPQMDFFIILIPISTNMRKQGILKNDSSNRVAFFENICNCSPEVEVSNTLSHERLPKSILYVK